MKNNDVPLEHAAMLFCIAAHSGVGQLRKYTHEPYHTHPIEVANKVRELGGSTEQIIAAYLHDVVEDTHITIELIEQHFGEKVATLVWWLTEFTKPEMGNRRYRKTLESIRWRMAPVEAKEIKLIDIWANAKDILTMDDGFAPVFFLECYYLQQVIEEGCRPAFVNQAIGSLTSDAYPIDKKFSMKFFDQCDYARDVMYSDNIGRLLTVDERTNWNVTTANPIDVPDFLPAEIPVCRYCK